MTGWITSGFVFAALATGVGAQEKSLLVGAVISQTGSHAAAAADYRKGLILWAEAINAGDQSATNWNHLQRTGRALRKRENAERGFERFVRTTDNH